MPLAGATVGREYVRVGYSSEQVEHANDVVDTVSGAQIDGMVARAAGQAFGEQMPAEDLQSATALQQRRKEARDAEENAARLEAEAREQAEDAKSAQARADERSGDAADAQQAALRAREDSDQLKP